MICEEKVYLEIDFEDDYDPFVEWRGQKMEVFNLEEWMDIETIDYDESVLDLWGKSYSVVVYAEGIMNDDSLFYDFSDFKMAISDDDGFLLDLQRIEDEWCRRVIRGAYNRFCKNSFHLSSQNMGEWEWDY